MLLNSITDYQGQCQQMAFVQYGFDRNEHPIDVKPHGNSKGKKPFSRCKASTLKMLKRSAEAKPPLQALRQVENIRGGGGGGWSTQSLVATFLVTESRYTI